MCFCFRKIADINSVENNDNKTNLKQEAFSTESRKALIISGKIAVILALMAKCLAQWTFTAKTVGGGVAQI